MAVFRVAPSELLLCPRQQASTGGDMRIKILVVYKIEKLAPTACAE
jgi:hypothetical protein